MDKFVVVDLETTGHSPNKNDRVMEIGVVVIEGEEIVDTKTTLLNPGKNIPPFITSLTGISDKDVAEAPLFEEKADKIAAVFKDSYFIAHNVKFDLGFLNAELVNNGKEPLHNPVIDTVELARILFPKAPGYKLGQLAEYLDIHHDDPHRALSDAYVTAKLFLKLKEKLTTLPYETLTHLLRLEKMLISDLEYLLEDIRETTMFSAEPEGMTSFQGVAFRTPVEESRSKASIDKSYGDFLDSLFETDGLMEQKFRNYEKREGQQEMAESIYDAFQASEHALIEAETGTGKSLAYLLPSLYESVHSKQKIVISTYTTQLQSQLLEEEIPMVEEITGLPFTSALLKGRSHYISLEKFAISLDDMRSDNYDTVLTKAVLLVWLTETMTGDIDEIQLPSSGYFFFRKVSTDAEGTMDPKSPWFAKSFYQRAKRKAQKADIIVTNHALLCMDIFNDYQFLPSYDKAIIDEAHHFETTASHHYGKRLDYAQVQFLLNQIGRSEEQKMLGNILRGIDMTSIGKFLDEWDGKLDDAKQEVDDLFGYIYQYTYDQLNKNRSVSDIGRLQYRYDEEKEETQKWGTIKDMASRLMLHIRDMIHILAMVEFHLEEKEKDVKYEIEDLRQVMETMQQLIDSIELLFFHVEDVPQIRWIELETKGNRNAVYLYSEPADVSGLLADEFFKRKKSIVLTSATLTMKSSFQFIQKRLGLVEDRLVTKKIASPFSYMDQVQLLVPNDFPDIKYGKMDDFIHATCEAILSLAEITKGRMLVLFTSYDMLKKSYYLLKEMNEDNDYMFIGQGITSGSRARLKKNFQSFDKAILLGTSSFWEGVDIPGEDLSALMIVRLPFQPPNHPVYEAKAAMMKDDGKNAFMELSLPNAVIKFKQGFGRLIRSSNDRGIVFICDARMVKARYGKYFTESIPEVPLTYDSTSTLIQKAEDWF